MAYPYAMRRPLRALGLPVAVSLLALSAGCAGPNARATGAFGTVAGAATGAVIGAASDNPVKGAIIGGVVGGAGGTAIGRAADIRDRQAAHDAAMEQAAIQQASYQQPAPVHLGAVSTIDLITMSQSGVGDEVICSMLAQRGCDVDLSPTGVISLKNSGVSDGVILAAQQAQFRPPASGPVVVNPPRGPVVIEREVHVVPSAYPPWHPHWGGRGVYRRRRCGDDGFHLSIGGGGRF